MRALKALPVLLMLSVLGHPILAEDAAQGAQKTVKSPSPDGQFAFLETVTPEFEREGTVDLIEQKSRKVLLRVEQEINVGWSAEWAADGKRFVVTSRVGHAIQGIDVYLRRGETFQAVELPKLTADIPDKLTHGRKLPHWAALNYQTALKWNDDGSLVVRIESMQDGEGGSASATRTVVLGFDRNGQARIVKSTIKFATEKPRNE